MIWMKYEIPYAKMPAPVHILKICVICGQNTLGIF